MTSPSLRFDAPRHEAELLRTPYTRSSQNTPQTNFRLCEVALLGHYPRSARHGSTGRKVFHFGVHVLEKNSWPHLQGSYQPRCRGRRLLPSTGTPAAIHAFLPSLYSHTFA